MANNTETKFVFTHAKPGDPIYSRGWTIGSASAVRRPARPDEEADSQVSEERSAPKPAPPGAAGAAGDEKQET